MKNVININRTRKAAGVAGKTLMDIIKDASVRTAITGAGFTKNEVTVDSTVIVDDGEGLWCVVCLHKNIANAGCGRVFTVYVNIRTDTINGIFWTDGDAIA